GCRPRRNSLESRRPGPAATPAQYRAGRAEGEGPRRARFDAPCTRGTSARTARHGASARRRSGGLLAFPPPQRCWPNAPTLALPWRACWQGGPGAQAVHSGTVTLRRLGASFHGEYAVTLRLLPSDALTLG